MEEILSSIKRIIAEDGEGGPKPRRASSRPPKFDEFGNAVAPEPDAEPEAEEVLELTDTVDTDQDTTEAVADAPVAERPPSAGPIVSAKAAEASRSSLAALSSLIVKPEIAGGDTLEGLVRDMLRPMLTEWLDANLPDIVERLVAKEISRLTDRDV